MPDPAPINTRVCRGACGRELPQTEEYFRRDSRRSQFAPTCRMCTNRLRTDRAKRARGDDVLTGVIKKMGEDVAAFCRANDPSGKEVRELGRRLQAITARFSDLPAKSKRKAIGWFRKAFLRP